MFGSKREGKIEKKNVSFTSSGEQANLIVGIAMRTSYDGMNVERSKQNTK